MQISHPAETSLLHFKPFMNGHFHVLLTVESVTTQVLLHQLKPILPLKYPSHRGCLTISKHPLPRASVNCQWISMGKTCCLQKLNHTTHRLIGPSCHYHYHCTTVYAQNKIILTDSCTICCMLPYYMCYLPPHPPCKKETGAWLTQTYSTGNLTYWTRTIPHNISEPCIKWH